MTGARPRIGVVTTSRADFGIYRAVFDALKARGLDFGVYVAGMHAAPEFGRTETEITRAGLPVIDRLETLIASDTESGVAASIGLGVSAFGYSFTRFKPELLIVLGDRFEMHAAALAALPFRIPVAHIHGGEETEGAIDNALRHSMTKLSHLHFCSTELSARRLRAMGEPSDRVIVSGAPALDAIQTSSPLSAEEMAERFSVPAGDYVLVTFHPETLAEDGAVEAADTLLGALDRFGAPVVLTGSNADPAGRALSARFRDHAAGSDAAVFVESFGAPGYYTAMRRARVMVGNSSSGIIEAAGFGLPVVNIGDRQKGRERSANTIDVAATPDAILDGLRRADDAAFRARARTADNVYGDGETGPRIAAGVEAFLQAAPGVRKRFVLDPS
ncbi:MAG: UDP-N-acetylglucosamine 2-epimerase [Pseudomonadota bacterium]